jgi:hypothetical protein
MLLIESDPERRRLLSDALKAFGVAVTAVGCIAEIERWPTGQVVVIEASFFSPWWNHVGATHVIVLADSDAIGRMACDEGATAWMPRPCTASELLARVGLLGLTLSAQCDVKEVPDINVA